jgi:hypothetical protein
MLLKFRFSGVVTKLEELFKKNFSQGFAENNLVDKFAIPTHRELAL